MSFLDDLKSAKDEVASGNRVRSEVIPVAVGGKLHKVFFLRASADLWAEATVKHLPREGVAIDYRYGYNLSGVTREVAPTTGRVLDGDDEVELSREQWDDLWSVLPGPQARTLEANVWVLNEQDPEQEIERLGKASTGGSRKKRS